MILVNANSPTNTYECTHTYKNTYKHTHNMKSINGVLCLFHRKRKLDKKPEGNNLDHLFDFLCCKDFHNAYFVFHYTMVID